MTGSVHPGSIVILDFGGQYAHLIASRIRRFGYFSEIRQPDVSPSELKSAAGIILSGGPQSVYEKDSPQADKGIFDLGIPILGLCYGHQWVAHALGGKVGSGNIKEYGHAALKVLNKSELLKDFPGQFEVWMSHGDEVKALPVGFERIAETEACSIAVMADEVRKIFGIQFHIEVAHTQFGLEILKKFADLCRPAPWSIESYAMHVGGQIKQEVGDKKVFMLVSGGVDSTVAFTLLNETLGTDRVQGLLVDTGLMRKNEVKKITEALQKLGITNLHVEDASDQFFKNLEGVYEPEAKRKVIGDTFLAVQKRVSERMGIDMEKGWMLGQGTIYPDTIETGGTKHADKIKTHHNRVEAIQKMIEAGLVIEPLKELYKDEVRKLGEELGLPRELVWRHPFPGPGLGVRILCAFSALTLNPSPEGRGTIASRSLGLSPFSPREKGLGYEGGAEPEMWAVLPIKSVGVQGDGRTYRQALVIYSDNPMKIEAEEWGAATAVPNSDPRFNRVLKCISATKPPADGYRLMSAGIDRERANLLQEADSIVDEEMRRGGLYEKIWQFPVVLLPVGIDKGGQSIVLRPINSEDAMTANAARLPAEVLECMTGRLMKLAGIDAVFLDLTNKPPATIEWE